MGKILYASLLFIFSLTALAPSGVSAATLYGGDYARVGVPDLAQAVAFFQDVLDCRLIGSNPAAAETGAPGASAIRLLSCDAGSIVELFVTPATSPSPTPVQFVADSDDVRHAGEWLRHEGVRVGSPHRLTSGPLAGRMAIDFVSPWGMPLRLLGNGASTPVDGLMATADASFDGG